MFPLFMVGVGRMLPITGVGVGNVISFASVATDPRRALSFTFMKTGFHQAWSVEYLIMSYIFLYFLIC